MDSDIVEARFVDIVPGERLVQAVDFVSDDPAYAGTMTMTWEVTAVDAGTRVDIVADPMEAYRRGDQFLVHLDMPGVNPDDVSITLERNVVAIRAERRSPRQEGDEVLIDERPQGSFTRQLFLGENLDAERLNASYDKGVLTLTIPVSEQAKPRRVKISTEPGQQPQPVGTSAGQPGSR